MTVDKLKQPYILYLGVKHIHIPSLGFKDLKTLTTREGLGFSVTCFGLLTEILQLSPAYLTYSFYSEVSEPCPVSSSRRVKLVFATGAGLKGF